MKKALVVLMVLITVFSMISCPGDDDDDNNDNSPGIIPGEKLLDLFIDEPFSTCRSRYGEPDSATLTNNLFFVMYFSVNFSIFVEDSNQNSQLDDSDPIYRISQTSFTEWSGTTAGGNGIGSNLDSVQSEFGECEQFIDNWCSYHSIGIEFAFLDSTDSCDIVGVQRP